MKKIMYILIMLLSLSIQAPLAHALEEPPTNSAVGAVLMEVESGRVLYEKNAYDKMPMASTTKVMTAIIAIENSHPADRVMVSKNASGIEGSSLYLATDEELTMEHLLYGLMLRSGNDAAAAIAEHVGKSIEGFAKMMNDKAKELGAMNTNFANPHGLHDDNHYTTAYDLALISAYAMKNPLFREIVSTKYYKIPWEGQPWDRVLMNKNALLWEYEGANGIKTGYTRASGRCLVSSARRDGMQLVAVVLNCQPWFEDSEALLSYGFGEYGINHLFIDGEIVGEVPVEQGFEKKVDLFIGGDISLPLKEGEINDLEVTLKHPESLKAPIRAGTRVGSLVITLGDDVKIAKDIYTVSNIEDNTLPSNLRRILKGWVFNTSIFP